MINVMVTLWAIQLFIEQILKNLSEKLETQKNKVEQLGKKFTLEFKGLQID